MALPSAPFPISPCSTAGNAPDNHQLKMRLSGHAGTGVDDQPDPSTGKLAEDRPHEERANGAVGLHGVAASFRALVVGLTEVEVTEVECL